MSKDPLERVLDKIRREQSVTRPEMPWEAMVRRVVNATTVEQRRSAVIEYRNDLTRALAEDFDSVAALAVALTEGSAEFKTGFQQGVLFVTDALRSFGEPEEGEEL